MLWVIKSTATGTFQQFPTPTAHKRLHPRKPLTPTQERDHHPRFHPTFLKGCMKHKKKRSSFRIFFFFFFFASQVPSPHAGQRPEMLRRNGDRQWTHSWILSSLLSKPVPNRDTDVYSFTWMALKLERAKNQLNRELPQSLRPLSFLLNIHVTPRHSGVSYMTDTLG